MRAAASVAHRTCSQRGPMSTPSLGRRGCQEDPLQVALPLHQQQTPLHQRTTLLDQQTTRLHKGQQPDPPSPHRGIAMMLQLGFSRSHQGPRAKGYLSKFFKDLTKTTPSFPTIQTLSTTTSKGFPQPSMFSGHSLQQHNPRESSCRPKFSLALQCTDSDN